MGGPFCTFPGGKGANQAVAAARMGAAVSFVGSVGGDAYGTKVRAALKAESINLKYLTSRKGEATGLGVITVAEGGENTIVVAPGANALLSPGDVQEAAPAITGAAVLLLQLEVPMETVITAARLARDAQRVVILNAAPGARLSAELLRLVDVLIVNRSEAALVLDADPKGDPANLAVRLPNLGVATVIMTLGQHGAMLNHRGRPRRIASIPVAAVDSVGAGDAFCGAIAAAWGVVHAAQASRSSEEFHLVERAAFFACVAGALATTKAGAIPSLPLGAEVLAQAERFKVTA